MYVKIITINFFSLVKAEMEEVMAISDIEFYTEDMYARPDEQ